MATADALRSTTPGSRWPSTTVTAFTNLAKASEYLGP